MNHGPNFSEDRLAQAGRDEIMSELFLDWVTSQGGLGFFLLGMAPHPETGQPQPPNLESAKIVIDQLEMMEFKSRGNLNAAERELILRTISVLRTKFAETLDTGPVTS